MTTNTNKLPSLSIDSRDFRPASWASYMAPVLGHHHTVVNDDTGEELFSSCCFFEARAFALGWQPTTLDLLNAMELDL